MTQRYPDVEPAPPSARISPWHVAHATRLNNALAILVGAVTANGQLCGLCREGLAAHLAQGGHRSGCPVLLSEAALLAAKGPMQR